MSRLQVYFRSDKINMRPEEIAAKQEQASQLQDELKRQIQEKRRLKVSRVLCYGPQPPVAFGITVERGFGLPCQSSADACMLQEEIAGGQSATHCAPQMSRPRC